MPADAESPAPRATGAPRRSVSARRRAPCSSSRELALPIAHSRLDGHERAHCRPLRASHPNGNGSSGPGDREPRVDERRLVARAVRRREAPRRRGQGARRSARCRRPRSASVSRSEGSSAAPGACRTHRRPRPHGPRPPASAPRRLQTLQRTAASLRSIRSATAGSSSAARRVRAWRSFTADRRRCAREPASRRRRGARWRGVRDGAHGRRPAELDPIGCRLARDGADELVGLGELGPALFEPVGKPLVQLRPRLLRQRVVGRVADQQVAEPEGVSRHELRPDPGG